MTTLAVTWPPRRSGSAARRPLPRGLARLIRPVQDGLAAEITGEVQRRIAEYGPGAEGVDPANIELVITRSLRHYAERLEDPAASRAELDETLQRLGRSIAYDGRRPEVLTAAYDIGAELSWQRITSMAGQHGLSPDVIDDLGDDLVDYMASLAAQSTAAYHEAQEQLSVAAHQWQARVLELVLAGDAAPYGELAARASAGGWVVPDCVALVAVRPSPGTPLPSTRMMHSRTLSSLHTDRPVVLLPAPVTASVRDELADLFAGHRIAVGCEVAVADAASSLRWAHRALDLAARGVLPDAPVIDCAEHLGTLWIHAEPGLADIVVATTLAPLFAEPRNSRRILGQTLLHWISTPNPSAPSMAEALGVHPQTVRYRLKRLRDVFGDGIDDPAKRLEMFFALRVSAPQWNDGQPLPV
ncbi:CdaR family transcriptional regulator [Jatrophihabitans endophyticus]|uniref:PucR family transcriptional regulator n=1 Tax=Jatrophihabitans endophyticus TaxID=1206085 RepID=UPI001A0A81CF|nr:helix-turn-helix domain-containing protein [Jatrophihabitans endophyticus]MBE7187718.1 helix-turn-helix domain-containing protein [Jatrophihabitans endophyticus]